MTFGGNPQLEKKWTNNLPIIWKRNIKSLIKSDRQKALKVFFENFKIEKESKHMKYGLELLLPDSLNLIANSFKDLKIEETTNFLELIASDSFTPYIIGLNKESQEAILNQIYQTRKANLIDGGLIRLIVPQIDFRLAEILYSKLTNEVSKSQKLVSMEIIKLWGSINHKIFSILLKEYLKKPIKPFQKFFREISPNDRIEAIQLEQSVLTNSIQQLNKILPLFSTTKDDLLYIYELLPKLQTKLNEPLNKWLSEKDIDYDCLLQIHKSRMEEENENFILDFLTNGIDKDRYQVSDVLISLLNIREEMAHDLLKKLSSMKNFVIIEIIISLISSLDENQVSIYSKFLHSELEKYSNEKTEFVLLAYVNSMYEYQQNLYLSILQKVSTKNWKEMIDALQSKDFPSSPLIIHLFSTNSKREKRNIGRYIIKTNAITKLNVLFQDFDIFHSILTTNKKLEVDIQDQIMPFVSFHVKRNFSKIIQIGEKLTFPRHVLSSVMEDHQFNLLLDPIISSSVFLESWKDIFILNVKETLPITLKRYTEDLPRNVKKKENLTAILKMLIKLEPIQFWEYIYKYSEKDISESSLKPIIKYGFEVSIPNIGEILSKMPEFQLTYIIENILPDFTSMGSKILYSLFTIHNISEIQESAIRRVIIELIKLDQDTFLLITLIRCSKIINNPDLKDFTLQIVPYLISNYPFSSFSIIANYELDSLFNPLKSYIMSLEKTEAENLILLVIPKLKSERFEPMIIDRILPPLAAQTNDTSLFNRLCEKYEEEEFKSGGKKIFKTILFNLIGKSSNSDFQIFNILRQKPRSQSLLIPLFLTKTSIQNIERILLDQTFGPLETQILRGIINYFETDPPKDPESYFFSLYQQSSEKEDVQEAILPLLGEYFSWQNLPVLMELPEKEKYSRSYEKALAKFASRFNITSSRGLKTIWNSGLKNIYNQTSSQSSSLLQSHCPQCGNPILEGQKNCGFCNQGLTCSICRKSVVLMQREDIVQCPQCGNFFHRSHIRESVKIKKNCPVCNVSLREKEVESLSNYNFLFQ
ncbi:MAG: hypothetical protein ACFFAU_16700 [Candidatus Hodarchaeota archaeon]